MHGHSTRQLVRDTALLLLLPWRFCLDLLSVATRVLHAFRAGSLVTEVKLLSQ